MKYFVSLIFSLCVYIGIAHSVTSVDITRSNVAPVPIAIPDFINEGSREYNALIRKIIINDLETTGLFRVINKDAYIQNIVNINDAVEFASWRQVNASALLTGQIKVIDRKIVLSYRVWDIFSQKLLSSKTLTASSEDIRTIAHKVADDVYYNFIGDAGYFNTKIAYISVVREGRDLIRRLAVMDYDGANHQFLTKGENIVLTPRFSPDSQELLYLSYRGKKTPKVMAMNLKTGFSRALGKFKGMSYAPRYTPNGKHVLLSAEKRGVSNIFMVDLDSMNERQITNCSSICVSPSASPDGKKIVFNSDMGGGRHLYVMNSDGSNIKKISFGEGQYSGPVWSPRGDLIAFTKMIAGRGFFIGVMKPDGTGERIIARGWLVEGATWAPNGRVILFEKVPDEYSRDPKVYAIDISGHHETTIDTPYNASDASWSNFIK
jgi:TolB protein